MCGDLAEQLCGRLTDNGACSLMKSGGRRHA